MVAMEKSRLHEELNDEDDDNDDDLLLPTFSAVLSATRTQTSGAAKTATIAPKNPSSNLVPTEPMPPRPTPQPPAATFSVSRAPSASARALPITNINESMPPAMAIPHSPKSIAPQSTVIGLLDATTPTPSRPFDQGSATIDRPVTPPPLGEVANGVTTPTRQRVLVKVEDDEGTANNPLDVDASPSPRPNVQSTSRQAAVGNREPREPTTAVKSKRKAIPDPLSPHRKSKRRRRDQSDQPNPLLELITQMTDSRKERGEQHARSVLAMERNTTAQEENTVAQSRAAAEQREVNVRFLDILERMVPCTPQ